MSAGVLPLPGRRLVEVEGADALDYLHRMLTQDIAGLAPGQGAAACLLSPTGRVLAHLLVWRLGGAGRLLLDLAAGSSPEALARLERYVIADDVAFHDAGERWTRLVCVASPGSPVEAALGAARGDPGAAPSGRIVPWDEAGGEGPGARGFALALPFGARVAHHLLVAPARAAARLAALEAAGATRWSLADLERARVEEGVPWAGAEIDERILPNEARLDDAVSFTKGCYPGQEPVVMARHRGHPSTLLVRLALEDAPAAGPGTALLEGAREVGRLTTVAPTAAGPAQALGFVRHALARPGQALALAAGGRARVV